jgi:hypothetical protein
VLAFATALIQQFAFGPAHAGFLQVALPQVACQRLRIPPLPTVGMPRADEGYWP